MCREREAPNTRTAPRRERTRDSTRHRRRTGHARPPQAGRFHSGKPPPGGLPRYRISPWTEDAPSTVPGGVGSTEHMHVHQPRLPPAQGQVEAGPEAIRTWERGHPTERRQVFVVIPPIYPRPHDRAMCSHVRAGSPCTWEHVSLSWLMPGNRGTTRKTALAPTKLLLSHVRPSPKALSHLVNATAAPAPPVS